MICVITASQGNEIKITANQQPVKITYTQEAEKNQKQITNYEIGMKNLMNELMNIK